MNKLVERAAHYAAQARSAADARGVTKPQTTAIEPQDVPPSQTPREWWTVYFWGRDGYAVKVAPPQTQRAMRELYPEAAGIVAIE